MKKSPDSNFAIRYLHLHCFIQIYRSLSTKSIDKQISAPRFKLFEELSQKSTDPKKKLFLNILSTFKGLLITMAFVTIIFSSLNLIVPQLIKMFMHYMHQHHSQKSDVNTSYSFLRNFLFVQILRIIFGEHSKRLSHELAIKVESSLSRKLVEKSLKISKEVRNKITRAEIIELQNVDLKLVFNLFKNFYMVIQAPFTVIVAIILLFIENKTYGLIGIYWFLIIFLVQRELDQKMAHCNQTKLGLIDQRSKFNYEMLQNMKQAKMIGWEDLVVQKNNQYFIEENQDHVKYYQYSSLSDIVLLMMPVLVVVSICIFDMFERDPITVEQVYLMLSLLGICTIPMKSFRILSISYHDGMHSLLRFQHYFDMKDQQIMINNPNIPAGQLNIPLGTIAVPLNQKIDYQLVFSKNIEVKKGQRLIILGKHNHGKTSVLQFIVGRYKKQKGDLLLNSTISYYPNYQSKPIFFQQNIKENILLYDEQIRNSDLEEVIQKIGLTKDLDLLYGLDTNIDDIKIFNKCQKTKILLARNLAQNADVYIFDEPFLNIDLATEDNLQNLLRQMQRQKQKTIIMSLETFTHLQPTDKIIIMQNGITDEYGTYEQLLENPRSNLLKFQRRKRQEANSLKLISAPSISQKSNPPFDNISSNPLSMLFGVNPSLNNQPKNEAPLNIISLTFRNIMRTTASQKRQRKKVTFSKTQFIVNLKKFLTTIPFSETIFILIIIAAAQFLHIFIHFFIGHLEEDHGNNVFLNFGYMVVIEVILTLGLALILYFEGQVSSKLALIQGNMFYQESLNSLAKKRIGWFQDNYSIKIADMFNHDYEQVFIAVHSLLGIYKNLIILLATIQFISNDYFTLVCVLIVIGIFYASIFWTFHRANEPLVKSYFQFKYSFVKVLEDSIHGAELIRIHHRELGIINRAKQAYKRIAGYKQAQMNTTTCLSISCDLMSVILLSTVVGIGLKMKMHNNRYSIALIATSIHLLMNGSQVLKNIIKDIINFQSFFALNFIPFMKVASKQSTVNDSQKNIIARRWDIDLKNISIHFLDDVNKNKPLSLHIKQGEKVLIYAQSDYDRNLMLNALTANLPMLSEPQYYEQQGKITIGDVDIRYLLRQCKNKLIGVISKKNFYTTGTLRENLSHKLELDEYDAKKFIKIVKLDLDLVEYQKYQLDSIIQFESGKVNHDITKKLAIIRVLLNKSKIIIIHDTSSFIGSSSITALLQKYNPECTIIKISNKVEAGYDVNRVIMLRNMKIIQDGNPLQLIKNDKNEIGRMFKASNIDGYLFANQGSKKRAPKLLRIATMGL